VSGILAEERFHVVLRGIHWEGVRLPDLGVFADPTHVELDYRMGSEWDAEVLRAVVEMLTHLRQLAPGSHIDLEETVRQSVREHFRRSVEAYLAAGPT
jgi:hypothetical protein